MRNLIRWGAADAIPRWFYSERWNTYQRVQGRVAVYIEKQTFGAYAAKLYTRGEINICKLEARITYRADIAELITLAESWLTDYHSGNLYEIMADPYYVFSTSGVWSDREAKRYYLCHKLWRGEDHD